MRGKREYGRRETGYGRRERVEGIRESRGTGVRRGGEVDVMYVQYQITK